MKTPFLFVLTALAFGCATPALPELAPTHPASPAAPEAPRAAASTTLAIDGAAPTADELDPNGGHHAHP